MSEMDTINKMRELRDAFGSFMTGVTVVTTCKEDGTPLGFTANSFASVSLDPALLLVSIAKTSSNYHNFANATHFAINIWQKSKRMFQIPLLVQAKIVLQIFHGQKRLPEPADRSCQCMV